MSDTSSPVIRQPGAGGTVAVVGDIYRFLAMGEDTNGKYALWEAIVAPGGGPPPHSHSREEEGFHVLEGEITFLAGDRRVLAQPGTFINMPVGSVHAFTNATKHPARMLICIAPAGLEKMFFEIGLPVPADGSLPPPPTKEDIDKLLKVAPRYGIDVKLPQ